MNTAARLQSSAEPGQRPHRRADIPPRPRRRRRRAGRAAGPAGQGGARPGVPGPQVASLSPMRTRRLDAPMVGRHREAALLEGAFERAASDRACQLFTVPGVRRRRQEPPRRGVPRRPPRRRRGDPARPLPPLWRGDHLVPGDRGAPGRPRPPGVRRGRDGPGGDPRRRGRARSTHRRSRRTSRACSPPARAARPRRPSGRSAGSSSPAAGSVPLVLVLDDIHWGEPTFLDFVEHVADWSQRRLDPPALHGPPRSPRRAARLGRRQDERDDDLAAPRSRTPSAAHAHRGTPRLRRPCRPTSGHRITQRRRGQPAVRRGDAADARRRRTAASGTTTERCVGRDRRPHRRPRAAHDLGPPLGAPRPALRSRAGRRRGGRRRRQGVPPGRRRRAPPRSAATGARRPPPVPHPQGARSPRSAHRSPARTPTASATCSSATPPTTRSPRRDRARLHRAFADWLEARRRRSGSSSRRRSSATTSSARTATARSSGLPEDRELRLRAAKALGAAGARALDAGDVRGRRSSSSGRPPS